MCYEQSPSFESSVEYMVSQLESQGLEPQDLDELVLDVAEMRGSILANIYDDEGAQEMAVDSAYDEASDVNNGGLSAQVRFLISHLGVEEAKREVERIA